MLVSTEEIATVSITHSGLIYTYDRDGKARELAGVVAEIELLLHQSST
jgi:hypothetical protein